MKIYIIIIILIIFFFESGKSLHDSTIYKKNIWSVELNNHYFINNNNFINGNEYDLAGQQLNKNTYSPSFAKNKYNFSIGINYERGIFKNKKLRIGSGVGFGTINYELGFIYRLKELWNSPSISEKNLETRYKFQKSYIYFQLHSSYEIYHLNNISFGFFGTFRLIHFVEHLNFAEKWFVPVVYQNSNFLIQYAGVSAVNSTLEKKIALIAGLKFDFTFNKRPISINLGYKTTLYPKLEESAWISFYYYKISEFDQSTGTFKTEITGIDRFVNTLRSLEFTIKYPF